MLRDMSVDFADFVGAVERQYGGTATFKQTVPVVLELDDECGFAGLIHIFDVRGGRKTMRVYAWREPVDRQLTRDVTHLVLHAGAVTSPSEAVRNVFGRRSLPLPAG